LTKEATIYKSMGGDNIKGNTRILLVDDHSVTRAELSALLKQEPDLDVVGEACNGNEAVELAHILLPDVIIMDVFMNDQNGIDATRRIVSENPDVRIIGFSMQATSDIVVAMQEAGAKACISKSDSIEVLIQAIHSDEPDDPSRIGQKE